MPKKFASYRVLEIHLLLCVIALSCRFENLKAQDPVFSQFMFNQMYFNPAFAGTNENQRFIAGYRNQWPGLGNAYVSYYASFDQYVEKLDGGIGIALNRDDQGNGVFTKTGLDVMYSYPVELNSKLLVNFGLQASMVQNSVNASGFVFYDPVLNPPSLPITIANQSKIYPDFSAGLTFYMKEQYQVSLAVHHLNTPNEMNNSSSVSEVPMRVTFQILSQFPAKHGSKEEKGVVFLPGLMVQQQQNYMFLSYGSNLRIQPFIAGFWMRHDLRFHLNTYTFLAGYSFAGVHLTYSYDLWVPKTNQQLSIYGSHEVTFIYLFKYNDPKKKMRAIKCPKF